LRRLVRLRRFREALLRVDAMALASTAPPETDLSDEAKRGRALVAAVKTLCDKHARRCDELRSFVDTSLPWRPRARLSEIAGRLRVADLQEAWRGLEEASWVSTNAAGDLLAGELTSGRLGNVWPAARALRSWLGRIGVRLRERWIRAQMAHKPHVANGDEVQRYGFIAIVADQRELGDRLLRGLLGDGERRLVAAALLTMAKTRPAGAIAMLQGAASRRLLRLASAFPKKLDKASAGTARLVERELFVLLKVVEAGVARRPSAGGERLRQRIRRTLLKWRAEIGQVDSTFHPAAFVDLSGIAEAHAKGREAALRRLLRGRGVVERAVSRAVCERVDLPMLRRRCQAAQARGTKKKR
ncbi:MAG: hypothetical protein KAI47_16035, partial [Deltaproteobacteria bacterium]|nr:hypothetical protein [Deltaproteobacteria bacterium]